MLLVILEGKDPHVPPPAHGFLDVWFQREFEQNPHLSCNEDTSFDLAKYCSSYGRHS